MSSGDYGGPSTSIFNAQVDAIRRTGAIQASIVPNAIESFAKGFTSIYDIVYKAKKEKFERETLANLEMDDGMLYKKGLSQEVARDEDGQIIYKRDENGDLIQKVDETGEAAFDEDNNPIYQEEYVYTRKAANAYEISLYNDRVGAGNGVQKDAKIKHEFYDESGQRINDMHYYVNKDAIEKVTDDLAEIEQQEATLLDFKNQLAEDPGKQISFKLFGEKDSVELKSQDEVTAQLGKLKEIKTSKTSLANTLRGKHGEERADKRQYYADQKKASEAKGKQAGSLISDAMSKSDAKNNEGIVLPGTGETPEEDQSAPSDDKKRRRGRGRRVTR